MLLYIDVQTPFLLSHLIQCIRWLHGLETLSPLKSYLSSTCYLKKMHPPSPDIYQFNHIFGSAHLPLVFCSVSRIYTFCLASFIYFSSFLHCLLSFTVSFSAFFFFFFKHICIWHALPKQSFFLWKSKFIVTYLRHSELALLHPLFFHN